MVHTLYKICKRPKYLTLSGLLVVDSLATSVALLWLWPVSINDNFFSSTFGLCRPLQGSVNQFIQGGSYNHEAWGASEIKMLSFKTEWGVSEEMNPEACSYPSSSPWK